MTGLFPSSADTVIIGAGIVGNSLAYHLARLGSRNVVMLDKGPLPNPGGSTGHASSFIFPVDFSRANTSLTSHGLQLYRELGVYQQCGGIEVARTNAALQELTRRAGLAKSWGFEPVAMLTPPEVRELVPYIDEQVILGGFYTADIGVVDALRAGTLMREFARNAGALITVANTEVLGMEVAQRCVRAVKTSRGRIETERVVICCGVWSPRLARMAGAAIPLTPAVHQMIDLGPVPRFEATVGTQFPIIRDMDSAMYERQEGANLEIGSYAHRPMLVDPDEIPDLEESALSPTELPFTQADFESSLVRALELMPEIVGDESVGVKYAINGLLSVTPDGLPLLGETPEVRGLWSAAAITIKEGPGAGKALAEVIMSGDSEVDIRAMDIARFSDHEKTRAHVCGRAREAFNSYYAPAHPSAQRESDRDVRRSPFYGDEVAAGAVFHETRGWEIPHYYLSNQDLVERFGDVIKTRESEWEARWWSPIIVAEHLALRSSAVMIDLSALGTFDVSGPGALAALQRVALADVDVPVGKIIETPLLTPGGGIRSCVSIRRLDDSVFRCTTSAQMAESDRKWLTDQLPAGSSAQLHDETAGWCRLGVWGPRAQAVLARATGDDLSLQAFPMANVRPIEVDSLRVIAARMSPLGEDGWELSVPSDEGAQLWKLILEAGKPEGLSLAGFGVYGTTARLEQARGVAGVDLDGEHSAVESGLAAHICKEMQFIGREAHLRNLAADPIATLCTLTVESHMSSTGVDRYMLGLEPILDPNGDVLVDSKNRRSYVTSAGDGPSIGKYILMGYIPAAYAHPGEDLLVEYMGEEYPCTVATAGGHRLIEGSAPPATATRSRPA